VHLLDSIIAFAAIMLAASLMVTVGTQFTITALGLRGANLRRSLANLFEGACDDRDARRYGKVIASRVLRHPLLSGSIFSRLGIRAEDLPFVPADAAGKLRWAGDGIPFQPWLLGALGGLLAWPATLTAIQRLSSLDICSFSSAINAYVPFLSFCEHPWRTGALVGAVLGGLISRWRLATSVRCDELVGVLEKLATPPGGSLPDPAQRAMLVIAGQAQSGARSKTNSAAVDYSKFVRDLQEAGEQDMDAALDKNLQQESSQFEPRLDGVNSWFDHAMVRASQRFTMQARIITVALSLLLVFAAHFDAIRLFRMLSSDAQVREQLATSADALTKQAGQLSRTREDAAGKEIVPDIYRKAMVDALQLAPVNVPATKPKSSHSAHRAAAAVAAAAEALPGSNSVESPAGLQAAAQAPSDGALVQASAQPATDAPAKESAHKSLKSSKMKTPASEPEKSAAIPGEDRVTMEAKARAGKALETTAGFASREDGVSWLRATLNSDPALENLIANYEQTVNAQLVSDTDKLLDRSASLKHDLARSELQLIPENWTGWRPTGNEWPGFLVSLALLSLGAAICYNLLKTVASLRPLSFTGPSTYPERRIRREDRRNPQTREQARPQAKAQIKVPDKKVEEREPVTFGPMERLP